MEKRFISKDAAELFRPVIARNAAGQGQQSFAVSASENHAPAVA
jgi:hypothetical protein